MLIGAAAGVGAWFVARDEGPSYPDGWDERVRDLVTFVEDERGLEFEHPVAIEFLDEETWAREMSTSSADLSDDERREAEHFERLSRALGFVDGDIDLVEIGNEISVNGVLALYEFETEKVLVNGAPTEELSLSARGTIVHELTHVLQDQHFDLEALYESAGDRSAGLAALVEGDATNVEAAWVNEELSESEVETYDAEQAELSEGFDESEVEVPDVLVAFFSAPYQLGPPFAETLATIGSGRFNRAFEEGVPTEEHAFDPVSFLTGDTTEVIGRPKRPEGTREVDEGEFGVLSWFLMLSERIDPQLAFKTAQGWGGDRYVAYSEDETTCVMVAYRGERPGDTARMGFALQTWIDSLPADFARYEIDENGDIMFRSCDPGTDVELTTGKSSEALALPIIHNYIVVGAIAEGLDAEDARCVATKVVSQSTIEELTADEASDAFIERIGKAYASC
ncbi:MAG: hypothetical protein ACT4OX_02415 [Actinomycetota bacterium]